MPVSWNPQEQFKGGLIGDIDATLTSLRVENDIYQNGTSSVGLVGELTLDGGDKERIIWSLGSPEEWEIWNADNSPAQANGSGRISGVKVESTKGHTGVGDSSNVGMLMREIVAAGFPANRFSDEVTVFEGLYAHWVRKPQPKRQGLTQSDEREKTVLVPEKILANGLPWEASKRRKGAGAGRETQTITSGGIGVMPPPASAANDLENETALAIAGECLEALKQKLGGGTVVPKTGWPTKCLGVIGKNAAYLALPDGSADRAAVMRILKNAEWLAGNDAQVDAAGAVTLPKV